MGTRYGVDIAASGVRVAGVSGLDDRSVALVTRAGFAPLLPGAVHGGRIKDIPQVGNAIDMALKRAGAARYGIVVGLSSPEGAVSRVAMPGGLHPNEWAAVLRTSERDISPLLPVSESSLSIYPVEDIPAPEGKQMVMVGAVPHADVTAIVKACKYAKASPRTVDMSAAAILRCMTRTSPGNQDVATIVDIGATKTTVATRQGAHLRSVRTVVLGSDDITRAVMGELDCHYDEAERYKKTARVGSARLFGSAIPGEDSAPLISEYGAVKMGASPNQSTAEDLVSAAVTTAAAAIATEIANCIETDSARNPSNMTRGVVLCGGGALLLGMKELIAERVGVAVMLGRPWATLVPGRHTQQVLETGADEESVVLSMATAIGLALWKDPV